MLSIRMDRPAIKADMAATKQDFLELEVRMTNKIYGVALVLIMMLVDIYFQL